MYKDLMVCPKCGNSKNEVYAEIKEFTIHRLFIKCPECDKESELCVFERNKILKD